MQNYRVEYYDPKTNSMKVVFMDAEDLVTVKEKYKYKNMSVCLTKDYKALLEKFSDVMRPLKGE